MPLPSALRDVAAKAVIELDFRNVGHIEPFGMLFTACALRELRARLPDVRFQATNYQHMSYAAHMGFFQACGLDLGNAPGQARGSTAYLPITRLPCETLRKRAAEKAHEVGDEVEAESKHLAAMLCGTDEGPVFDTLTYSLRELMRNVVEHSLADSIWICAQYWPSQSRVEVAILDEGIGLRATLVHNPHLDVSDDKRAINYALMPAVSGRAFKGAPIKQRGHWANSGFGLYMTNRIARNGGNFFLASGRVGMLTSKTGGKRYFDCAFQGTAVRMVMRTSAMANLAEVLEVYRTEGYAIQSRYKEIVSIDPSSASLMLSEDFDLSLWDKLLSRVKGSGRS